jgi:hypothetical protein
MYCIAHLEDVPGPLYDLLGGHLVLFSHLLQAKNLVTSREFSFFLSFFFIDRQGLASIFWNLRLF